MSTVTHQRLASLTLAVILASAAPRMLAQAVAAPATRMPEPVAWSIARAPNARAVAGGVIDATITATITGDWHVYSLTQAPNGPSALLVGVPNGQLMFDMARVLMTADLRAQHPAMADSELRVRLFERTYGNDFNEADRNRISAQIRSANTRAHRLP